jgi:hypothetical protein
MACTDCNVRRHVAFVNQTQPPIQWMSAWIRSVTGRAYQFEPLNAKWLERPSNPERGEWMIGWLDYWEARAVVPRPSGNPRIHYSINPFRTGWCELVEETSQGFELKPGFAQVLFPARLTGLRLGNGQCRQPRWAQYVYRTQPRQMLSRRLLPRLPPSGPGKKLPTCRIRSQTAPRPCSFAGCRSLG